MISAAPTFCRGFIRGSLLGCALLAVGLLSWLVGILVGAEKDTSLAGFSLTPLYVLSFGLAGSALGLLRRSPARWYNSVLAWAAAVVIVLLGCSAMAFLLESDKPVDWSWGGGSALLLGLLLAGSIAGRRIAELGVAPNGGPAAPLSGSEATKGPPSVN
jgi:hypothetical protein